MSANNRSSVLRTDAKTYITNFLQVFDNLGVLLMLVIVLVAMAFVEPRFFVVTSITNILITSSIVAVAGFGMTLAITMRGIDLSVGSTQALTACIAASLLGVTSSIPRSIAGALLAGLMIGITNGLLISKLKVPPFVATLGMMSIVRGAALLFTDGRSILITDQETYALLNTERILGIPVPFVIALLTLAALYILLQHTPLGRYICAIGGNEAAANATGLPIDWITIVVFGLVGMTAALSGVMLSAQLMIVDGTLGVGLELKAIAIAVLGGTSLSGGRGNLTGTLIGALLLTTINSALNILKVPPYYQYLAVGLLLIFALGLDTLRNAMIHRMTFGR